MELPRLTGLYNKYRDQGLQVIALESFQDKKGALEFKEEEGLNYLLLENGEGDEDVVANVFGVSSFPTSFLIDSKGRILHAHVGFEEGDEVRFEEQIESLLGS